jgi:hypothetical protein
LFPLTLSYGFTTLLCEAFLAVGVPALQRRLRVDWPAVDVDLEVEVAADRDRVAGLPYGADSLARIDVISLLDQGRAGHVGVEVAAVLAFAVGQQVVAVEDRVVAAVQDAAAPDRDQWRVAGGNDVEALVGAAAAARGAEFADRAAAAVRALDREDVVVVGYGAVAIGEAGGSWYGGEERREEEES